MRKRKDITHEKNRKYRHIYNMFARVGETKKSAKETEREEKKIFLQIKK